MSAENPTIIPASGPAAPSAAPSNGITPADKGGVISRSATGSYKAESSNLGTFGVKSGLAQMLKGGVIMVRCVAARMLTSACHQRQPRQTHAHPTS